jgi:hypothetical protein
MLFLCAFMSGKASSAVIYGFLCFIVWTLARFLSTEAVELISASLSLGADIEGDSTVFVYACGCSSSSFSKTTDKYLCKKNMRSPGFIRYISEWEILQAKSGWQGTHELAAGTTDFLHAVMFSFARTAGIHQLIAICTWSFWRPLGREWQLESESRSAVFSLYLLTYDCKMLNTGTGRRRFGIES